MSDSTLEDRVAAGTVTLGDVTHLAAQVEALKLEVATHKARAAGAERSRDAHARASVQAIEELAGVRDYCDRMAKHHTDKAEEIDARLVANAAELDLERTIVERASHLGAGSMASSISLKVDTILTQRQATEAVGG